MSQTNKTILQFVLNFVSFSDSIDGYEKQWPQESQTPDVDGNGGNELSGDTHRSHVKTDFNQTEQRVTDQQSD